MTTRGSLAERLHLFIDELRARGLPVSMVERIDAMRAAELSDLSDRHALHTNLGATLVKSVDHLAVFDDVFDLFFRMPRTGADGPPPVAEPITGEVPDLDRALRTVLLGGSATLARQVAEQAVARYARFEAGRPAGGVMYAKWTLEGLRLDELGAELSGRGGARRGAGGGRDPVRENAELVRRQIGSVIRELLVADRGAAAVARTLRTPLTADVEVALAGHAELAEIERTMRPLQRKLATTLMRWRRRNTGALDVRATMRRSMGTGGVPITLVSRPPRPTKPALYVLADVSGSVANFAAFSICLMSAMGELFSRLRTFAFVQDAVEVTEVLKTAGGSFAAAKAVRAAVDRSSTGNYTDYGRSLTRFHDEIHAELGHRSTVLVLGDARGNNLPARVSALAAIAARAGSVYWLNPEPSSLWGTGDSVISRYAPYCTDVISCRTVNHLKRFVEDLD